MIIQLVSAGSERIARIDSKVLCKILHLACFHGWQPERLQTPPPSEEWDTELIVPYLMPYLSGSVSTEDAAGLAAGLEEVVGSEGPGLDQDVYFSALALRAVAQAGAFEVRTGAPTT